MTALADACHDLAQALPRAQALTHLPDTDNRARRSAPASRPPWNGEVAEALLTAIEGISTMESGIARAVTGHGRAKRRAARTGDALDAIIALSYALAEPDRERATRYLNRWTASILMLPAIDEQERPQRVAADCPYCGFGMLRLYARAGRVTCLRFGACYDSDGLHPVGHADRNRITGDGEVIWHDGLVT